MLRFAPVPTLALAAILAVADPSPVPAAPVTNVERLGALSERLERQLEARRPAVFWQLKAADRSWAATADGDIELVFLDPRGKPFWYATENVDAAATVNTSLVHPGGGFGFALSGSTTPLGQLAIWDGGAVRTSHQEFGGRAVQMDGASSYSNHATHVSGTLIASGVDPDAKGMSYAGQLACYDWSSDNSEMATAAAGGLRVSNHSYGFVTGWRFGYSDPNEWNWFGDIDVSTVEDYGFGFYSSDARDWDEIAHDAPYYLICASAGNDRNDFGPGPGGGHYVWDGGWVWSTDTRDPDGGPDGYDCVAWLKTAKNIMLVGAIEDLPGGWTSPGDVTMSTFSGWGPTDDGRIKPDLVANGVGLWSSTASNNSSYSSYGGTSMASPNLSGSANLVVDYYRTTEGSDPTSAMLKGILIHTANEAGASPGPDYAHGWGLLNTLGAAQIIQQDGSTPGLLTEALLANGTMNESWFSTASAGAYRATIVWTDPPGTPPPASLNPTTPMLVNDLDIRVVDLGSPAVYEPWVLDPANPASTAGTGDNVLDNVEQVWIADLPAGDYQVIVSHKGALAGGLGQAYALVSDVPLSSSPPATAVDEIVAAREVGTLPRVRPNPFSETTTITFELPLRAETSIRVFDVRGRVIRVLDENRSRGPGLHEIRWDGRGASGAPVASGVYLVRIEAGATRVTEKMLLLRSD